MGRPRGFDENVAIAAAASLFARRGYEGTAIDDLVTATGVHRASLYKAFGSKRGLYLAAVRQQVEAAARSALATTAEADLADPAGAIPEVDAMPEVDALVKIALDQGREDPEVAAEVARGLAALRDSLAARHPDPDAALAESLGRRVLAAVAFETTPQTTDS